MKSLSLVAQKGGAGKTTLAVHLAVYAAMRGEKVTLIDTDPQRSTAEWWRARGIPPVRRWRNATSRPCRTRIAQIRRVPENPEGDGVVLGNRKAIQIQVAHAHHGAVVTGQRERLKVAQRRFVVSGPQRCPPGVEILRGGRRRHKNGGRNERETKNALITVLGTFRR